MRTLITTTLLAVVAGCTAVPTVQLDDARFATGSRTMVSDADSQRLYAVNIDEGTISRVDLASLLTDTIDVGVEPTRIARAGNTYFVTLRGERSLAVFQDSASGLERLDTIEVGCEPYGVVASEDGKRLFVTLSQENKTLAIDVDTRQITHEWATPGDPRWLALHPKGHVLYVGAARGGVVYTVETDEEGDQAVGVIEMPPTTRTTFDGVYDLEPRVMGDPAVDPTGTRLVIPALYVDNKSTEDLPPQVDPTTAYYANPLPGIGRFNSAIVEVPLHASGEPRDRRAEAIFLANLTQDGSSIVRSYPNSVSISPDGLYYTVSMEGSDAVSVVGALPYDRMVRHDLVIDPGREVDPIRHGFSYRPYSVTTLAPYSAPRSVVYTDDDAAMVHNFLTLDVGEISVHTLQEQVLERGEHGIDRYEGQSDAFNPTVPIEASILPVDVREGRKLFYSATDRDLVAPNSGISCNTCHMDGRDDGLTWQLGPDVWQTPSLAGRVSDTHPVTWNKSVESVAAEAQATSTIRMGGGNLSSQEYGLMAAYVDFTREVDHPLRGVDDDLTRQGREIFEREEVGCAECHDGVAYTDNDMHELYGLAAVNTPTLRGIAATGPYLHDGRAGSIREVLELSRAGVMGDTSSLSEPEMDALEAYVLSL